MIHQSRRGFIAGLGALFVTAPAIVRAASIMPVKAIEDAAFEWSPFYTAYPTGSLNYVELSRITREAFCKSLFEITMREPHLFSLLTSRKT